MTNMLMFFQYNEEAKEKTLLYRENMQTAHRKAPAGI